MTSGTCNCVCWPYLAYVGRPVRVCGGLPPQFVDYTYFARSPGTQYGGHINISHLAVYGTATSTTAAAPSAVFDFGASGARRATIAERQNMKSVSIRCMIVVRVRSCVRMFCVYVYMRTVSGCVRYFWGHDNNQVQISQVRQPASPAHVDQII